MNVHPWQSQSGTKPHLGAHCTDKMYTAHTLLMGGTIGVGTPHNIERTWFSALLSLQEGFPTDAVVVVVGGWSQLHFIATSWLHLASWNLPDFQLRWESKMEPECGNTTPHAMKGDQKLRSINLLTWGLFDFNVLSLLWVLIHSDRVFFCAHPGCS